MKIYHRELIARLEDKPIRESMKNRKPKEPEKFDLVDHMNKFFNLLTTLPK